MGSESWGTFHITAGGIASWFDFAKLIVELEPEGSDHTVRTIQPIATEDFPTPARRPPNSALDCSALNREFGLKLPDWDWGVRAALEVL